MQLPPPPLRASASLLLATGLHSTADSRTKAHLHILSVKQLVDEVLLGLREKERPPAGEVKHASRCNAAGAARAGNAGNEVATAAVDVSRMQRSLCPAFSICFTAVDLEFYTVDEKALRVCRVALRAHPATGDAPVAPA